MFRRRALCVISALTIGAASTLAACNYSPPSPAVDQPVGLNVDASRVTLKDAGSGDKHVLAYKDIDAQQSITLGVTEGFSQDMMKSSAVEGYEPAQMPTTTTTLPLEGSVEQASDAVEGQQPATRNAFFTAGDVAFSGEKDASSAKGFQFGWRANDDGQMSSLRLAAPQAATDDARSLTEQAVIKLTSLPVIFPHDAVGKGGSWTVESRVTGQNNLLQTATYTVDKIDGDVVTLKVTVDQRPSLGALSFEGTAAGETLKGKELDVLDSSTTSEGTLTVDLTKPLPTAGTVNYVTKIVYGTQGEDLRVVQSSATKLTFS